MNKKRIFVYIAALFVFSGFVFFRKKQIIAQRKSNPVTFYGQWEKFGRPVVSWKIFRKDIPLYEKITLRSGKGGDFFGYVPRNIQKKLKTGQRIYSEWKGKKIYGTLKEVSGRISFDTGMYKIRASFDCPLKCSGRLVSHIKVGIVKNALAAPSSALVWENDKFYVWKIKGGKAGKTRVQIQRDGYGVLIQKGVSPGERIILEGFSALSEGDKILEVNEDGLND